MTVEIPEKVFVAGHQGLVGSAIVRRLNLRGNTHVLAVPRGDLDLRNQNDVENWFQSHCPDSVIVAAGTVGGIKANSTRPAEFIYDNMMIHMNVIEASRKYGVRKLLYLSSGCIYPRESPQPLRENYLMNGKMEETNIWYGIAKLAGIKACQAYRRQYGVDFISAIPATIYGPGDNFDPEQSHVIPGMIHKMYEAVHQGADSVKLWGSGRPRREFLYADDLADAAVFLLEHYSEGETINIGTGTDLSIFELASSIRDQIAPLLQLEFDASMPDGMYQKLLDSSRINSKGWKSSVSLEDGLQRTIDWYTDRRQRGGYIRGSIR